MSLFKGSHCCEDTMPKASRTKKNWGGGLHFKSLVHCHYGATWGRVDCHGAGYILIRGKQGMD